MKRFAILIAILAGFVLLAAWIQMIFSPISWYSTRTPELLGDAPAVFLRFQGSLVGVLWNDEPVHTMEGEEVYTGFLLYGSGERNIQCRLVRAWGGEIAGAKDPIPCFMRWHQNGRFQGWIDFRGHERAFCGGPNESELPQNCRLR